VELIPRVPNNCFRDTRTACHKASQRSGLSVLFAALDVRRGCMSSPLLFAGDLPRVVGQNQTYSKWRLFAGCLCEWGACSSLQLCLPCRDSL
jgi:hypothetical protein